MSIHCVGLKPKPKFTEPDARQPTPSHSERNRANRARPASSFEQLMTREIESYLGVPYKWGGSSRSGMDCSGFVRTVYENAAGISLPRKAKDMFKSGRFIEKQELKFGDLVFFENIENYGVSHVGIYLGENKFAHASTSKGVVISNLNEAYYRKRFIGARKVFRR
ncbi:MAG: C40 family peptidase [bacterium]